MNTLNDIFMARICHKNRISGFHQAGSTSRRKHTCGWTEIQDGDTNLMQTVSTCPEDNGSSFPDRSLGSKPKKKKLLDRPEEKFLTRLIYLLYCVIAQRLTTSHWHIFPKTIRTPVILMKTMIGNFLPLLRNPMFCWKIWLNLSLACQQNLILPRIGALSNLCTAWHKKVACQNVEQVLR